MSLNDSINIKQYGGLVGDSPPMQGVYELIDKAAQINVPVLITGETGTGKELVAREIHLRGPRKAASFVPVNTGALSIQLVASELFGHIKGSFTGAVANKEGRFTEADGGTLFLDEIATMDERVQIALLRVLETSTFRPVGAKHDKKVDVRLLAATNVDLRELAKSGRFRQDVLHRLEVFSINLPPLRRHMRDIPLLAAQFIQSINSEFNLEVSGIDPSAIDSMMAYHWPGNIRELKNALAQAAVMAERGPIQLDHLPMRIASSRHGTKTASRPQSAENPQPEGQAVRQPSVSAAAGIEQPAQASPEGIFMSLGAPLEEVLKAYVLKTLAHCSYNKTHAAETLGVSRKTLYDKLLQWGMEKRRV